MSHWKLTLAYDGTPYRGWQVQPGLPTIQGLLSEAIHRTVGQRILPQGSGRTDAGVHALAQVASFALDVDIPAANLQRALNRCLPPGIRILSAEIVPANFHARHSAIGKTYEYRIFPLRPNPQCGPSFGRASSSEIVPSLERVPSFWPTARISVVAPHDPNNPDSVATPPNNIEHTTYKEENICPPTLAPFVWPCPWPLHLDALNHAAAHILGTHDFTSFAATDHDLTHRTVPTDPGSPHLNSEIWVGHPPPPIRTITHSRWYAADGLLLYRVTGNGFLHHMVRNLVGTFVRCGAHRLDPASIPTLLAARNRAAAGPTAPASGLFLVSVDYQDLVNPLRPSKVPLTQSI